MNVVPIKPPAVPQDDAAINWQGWSADDPPPVPIPASNTLTIQQALLAYRETVLREQGQPRLQIGIPSFDRAMRGLQPGELLGILARTASGKTHLCNHVVEQMLKQRPTSAVLL